MTSLPWGFGLKDRGPLEMPDDKGVLQTSMNDQREEPITKKYAELRYRLMPYTYTLAWEARNSGMPLMRAMWLHYPNDDVCRKTGDQYLWGRDLLIAPVYEKGAAVRRLYLPKGDWYDWWTNTKLPGGRSITRSVDLATMPIYVRAGAIIPFDTVRQYTGETIQSPTELRIYTGADGHFILYDDDGNSQDYLKGRGSWTGINWNEKKKEVTLKASAPKDAMNDIHAREFRIRLIPGNETKTVIYKGQPIAIKF